MTQVFDQRETQDSLASVHISRLQLSRLEVRSSASSRKIQDNSRAEMAKKKLMLWVQLQKLLMSVLVDTHKNRDTYRISEHEREPVYKCLSAKQLELRYTSDTLSSSSDYQLTRKHKQEIRIETNKDDPSFLKEVEDKLQQSVKNLNEKFLVLSTEQINYLSYRLHAVLQPKRSPETQLIETWAIQSRDHIENLNMNAHTQPLQRHHSGHITVLKLSTILSKVKCLHIYQQQSEMIEAADLEIFPSLDAIEIRKMDAKVLSHLYLFAQTLETLCVEQIRIKCLRQVLFNEWESRDWKVLNALTIRSCDEFGIIDASINSLKAITSIDFGWNRITSITCTLECSSLKHLCLCHNQLSELPAMNSLTQLETLNLSMNQLHTLEGMQYLKSLKFLDISWNRLDGIREIEILRPLRSLRHINVKENPFTRRPDYRREVLFYLGDHVELDGKRWSSAETDSMAKCRKLESIIQEDLDNDIEYDSTASGPPTGSKETFEVALEYPVLEATSYSNHKGDVELTDISNPGFSYQTHIFFHPRFSQNQRGPYTVDDFFRQDDGTKRMVDQADIEALRLRSECHTVFGRETTHSFENDPIRGRKASISWSTDNANVREQIHQTDTAQIISSRRTFSSHEAQMYQLKPDEGVVCSLQFQPGTIIESYQVQLPTADPSKFFWDLTELVSVGLSIQMNENLIATRSYCNKRVPIIMSMQQQCQTLDASSSAFLISFTKCCSFAHSPSITQMLRTIATLLSLIYANAQPASPYLGIGSGKATGSQNAKCHEDPLGIFSFWNEHCLYENNVQKKKDCVEINDCFIDLAMELVELVISSNAPKMRNSRSLAHNDMTEAEKLSACLPETANEVRMDSFCQKVRHAVGLAFERVGDVLSNFSVNGNAIHFIVQQESDRLQDLEIFDEEITYRRMSYQTQLITSSAFEHQELGEGVHLTSCFSEKVEFAAAKSSELEFDQDAEFYQTEQKSCQHFPDENFIPYAEEELYLEVHPTFLSTVGGQRTFKTLEQASKLIGLSVRPNENSWSIDISALVSAEEIAIHIQLHRLSNDTIRVDFYRQEGDENLFVVAVNKIRNHCQAIDQDLCNLPNLEFDLFEYQISDESDPTAAVAEYEDLAQLLFEINSSLPVPTRFHLARQIKDFCQISSNRLALSSSQLKDQFTDALQSMIQDDNEDIMRFAVYCILTIAADRIIWSRLEWFWLSKAVERVLITSRKHSTKKLASQLAQRVNA
ncbi:unnamed protein product [Albugo candida]|uniref:Dynein axonemal light chain 1 n=1 Tax=Albugo candida TaxID=65357 RepID=A0A024G042_9STRA|nr:unnamed protein product [Albugo candida]|eukprot:CCI40222.1 unnamed protein product [Albugo candida]